MLSHEDFLTVVRLTPLVAIDLVVRDADGRVLMGLRTHEPARGCWFVPGGRIRKDETLDDAFVRISRSELGAARTRDSTRLLGVFTHCYDTNFADAPGVTTHYVVIACEIEHFAPTTPLPQDQHSGYRWWSHDEAIASDGRVHPNNLPYFR